MRIAILTNEYPPYVYGGAGVHVEYLTRELASLGHGDTVRVMAFGDQRIGEGPLTVEGVKPIALPPTADPRHGKLLDTLTQDLLMGGRVSDIDRSEEHTSELQSLS